MEQYNYYRAVEHDVLDHLENDGWFNRPSVINPFGEVWELAKLNPCY